MSAEADRLVARLKSRNLDQFVTLCKMHLSFLLDLPGSSLEELLDGSTSSESTSADKLWGFGNFTRKKSIKELSKSIDNEPVFGAPLSMNVIERILPLIRFLETEDSINQVGLFRKCGHLGRQKTLRERLNHGKVLEHDFKAGVFTAHDCANVLKLFLGEMQDPLLTQQHYSAHCQVAEMQNEEKKLQTVQLLIHLLPSENFSLLKSLLHLLHGVVCSSRHNLMTSDALGTLFAPHLLVPRKESPTDLHRKNQTMTKVVAFMIEHAPRLFSLPEAVMRDIRACLREAETRDSPRFCFSGSDLEAKRKLSCPDVVGARTENHEIRTSISFADRTASLQAAAETDTVRALGELYAHIANLPESSKKRKLLKQFNQASAVGTTPVDSFPKPRRTRSLTQSLKVESFDPKDRASKYKEKVKVEDQKLVGHATKTSVDAVPAKSISTSISSVSPVSATGITAKQFHTPVIKQHTSRTGATLQQPPLARFLKFDLQQPLSVLPSSLKLKPQSNKNEVPFVLCHPRGGSTLKGHSWTNLTSRSSDSDCPVAVHVPLQSSLAEGTGSKPMQVTRGDLPDEGKVEFVSPVKKFSSCS